MKTFLLIFALLAFSPIVLGQSKFYDVHSVLNYGAVGDGNADDTHAFKSAWEWTCKSTYPFPVMQVPSDHTFLVQPLHLQGPCNAKNIQVQINGKVIAPKKPSKWKCEDNECERWINFEDVDGIWVHGFGTIDGKGKKWWSMVDQLRPNALSFTECTNVQLSGLSFKNNPHVHIKLHKSSSVHISDILIDAPGNSPNTDGINIGESRNVFISNSKMGTGDDCVSIVGGSSHIDIQNITCGPGHGISIGSLGKDEDPEKVEYVHVKDCVFIGSTNGVRIKTWRGGRGFARHIVFEGITMQNASNPIIIDQHYVDKHRKRKPVKGQASAVHISNVTYSDIHGTSRQHTAVKLVCSEEFPCRDIYMEDINIETRHERNASANCENVRGKAHGVVVPDVPCLNHT